MIIVDNLRSKSWNNTIVLWFKIVFFHSGITIIKLQSNDPGNGGGDVTSGPTSCGGQYLNIYSDWEQPGGTSTGYFLENLSQSCLSLELVRTFLSLEIRQLCRYRLSMSNLILTISGFILSKSVAEDYLHQLTFVATLRQTKNIFIDFSRLFMSLETCSNNSTATSSKTHTRCERQADKISSKGAKSIEIVVYT